MLDFIKLDIKTNIKYNNYSSLPFEMQLWKASGKASIASVSQPSYVSREVKNGNEAILNRISDFDKWRISQPKTQ